MDRSPTVALGADAGMPYLGGQGLTYGAVSAVLISAAAVAAWFPAQRATAIAPVEALRAE